MQPTNRTKVQRVPARGNYDAYTIHAILDAHFLCHIGFVHESHPVVIPTLYGRKNDKLYIHGATSSRLITSLQKGIEVSVAVTLVDGIVLARSAFHHSMNYRSVVIFGTAEPVLPDQNKFSALKVISDQVLPGRWEEVRHPNKKELKATTVLSLPIHEASAKVRTGPPGDEKEDYNLDVWAGVLPFVTNPIEPVPDPILREKVLLSESITDFIKKSYGR
jgi:nitroimidazol reductase NimA-like FMN-containing flavoprotein (pyridoxamine 5'-phosphate oxidase superfamily)